MASTVNAGNDRLRNGLFTKIACLRSRIKYNKGLREIRENAEYKIRHMHVEIEVAQLRLWKILWEFGKSTRVRCLSEEEKYNK